MPKEKRKVYGQFFTNTSTADFMASLFNVDLTKQDLHILDAGAGSGILTAAIVAFLRENDFKGNLLIDCYEIDKEVIPLLQYNLNLINNKYTIQYRILEENYILSQKFGEDKYANRYDMVIGNPPYMKISKNAEEALSMPDVCHGAPNMYFLFLSMALHNLKTGGELVYIIPRSWTSGAYFEYFRNYLLNNAVISHIHLFGSRDKVFDGENVLQETMIIKVKKSRDIPDFVNVTFSQTSNFKSINKFDAPYRSVVGSNGYVFLITNKKEAEVLKMLNGLNSTLISDNLKMKTGIIVDFRTREVLRNKPDSTTFPLLYSQHIKEGRVQWPVGREAEYISTEKKGYLQENTNYLLVKRFTAKEEKRRLQCGIYLKTDHPEYSYISTQNKVNFIKCPTPELAYGLYVLMNSSIYDMYYRILNGSTQVNSTEINSIPVPDINTISQMGTQLMGMELSEYNCNSILEQWIKKN